MAALAAVLMLATIVLSAYMRHVQAGLGCQPWPACFGAVVGGSQQAGVELARVAHRFVASAVLILAAVMLVKAHRNGSRREARLTIALLAVVLALAALGVVTPQAQRPAVVIGNLLGGFVVFVLCLRLAQGAGAAAAAQRLAALAVALLVVQVALGALLSGSFAAVSCSGLADCLQAAQAAGWDASALNPLRVADAGAMRPGSGLGAAVQLAHRLLALACAAVLAGLAWASWRSGYRAAAVAIVLLLAGQVLLGWLQLRLGLPIALVLLHNLTAVLLLALAAAQLRASRPSIDT